MTNNLVKICIYLYHMIFLRYDILCVVKDSADPVADEALLKFVGGNRAQSHFLAVQN